MLAQRLARGFARPAFIALLTYVLLVGATYTGILTPELRWIDVGIVGGALVVWGWKQRRWAWRRTPLDLAIAVWVLAFALSLVANHDSWRRIVIGVWFMGAYIGAWYLLYEGLANRAIRRAWLIDGVLIAGVPIVFVAYAQVWLAISKGLPIPTPVGTLGNINTLAAFLVMMIPFAAGRLTSAKSPLARVLLGVYFAASLLLLVMTFSRGGWAAGAIALAVWVSLRLPVKPWWNARRRWQKGTLITIAGVVAVAVGYVIVESFGIGGRGIDQRTWIYETAIRLFEQRPLTGHGLFTFGAGLSRLNSLPPLAPHSHAHNVILQVAADLGMVGLIALALTAWVALQTLLRARVKRLDAIQISGIAAFAGFAAHQMVDVPAMMPTIALVALIALLMATAPDERTATALPEATREFRRAWQPLLVAVGGVVLVITGGLSAASNSRYVAILSEASASKDFHAAAEQLQALADGDPDFALYPEQQGILLGLAAAAGDPTAAQAGIERFERFTTLEPDYANGWANLAALHFALDEKQAAVASMHRAIDLAPKSWSLQYRYGVYAEAVGDYATARQAYQAALDLEQDVAMIPGWADSAVRRALSPDESSLSGFAQTTLMLERGENEAAQTFAASHPSGTTEVSSAYLRRLMIALSAGDRDTARTDLTLAQQNIVSRNGRIWTEVGAALLTTDDTAFERQMDIAREGLIGAPYEGDWEQGEDIAYIQYLRLAIPRQFIPQVGYYEIEPTLIHLLGEPGAIERLRASLAGVADELTS